MNARGPELARVTADHGAGERGGLVEAGDVIIVGVREEDRRDAPAAAHHLA